MLAQKNRLERRSPLPRSPDAHALPGAKRRTLKWGALGCGPVGVCDSRISTFQARFAFRPAMQAEATDTKSRSPEWTQLATSAQPSTADHTAVLHRSARSGRRGSDDNGFPRRSPV